MSKRKEFLALALVSCLAVLAAVMVPRTAFCDVCDNGNDPSSCDHQWCDFCEPWEQCYVGFDCAHGCYAFCE